METDAEAHPRVFAFLLHNIDPLFAKLCDSDSASSLWLIAQTCSPFYDKRAPWSSQSKSVEIGRWQLLDFAQHDLKHQLKDGANYNAWKIEAISVFKNYDSWDEQKQIPIDCPNANLFLRRNVSIELAGFLSDSVSAS